MTLSCYACGNDLVGTPVQLPAVAKEGIYHHLCAECAHMIGHARVFRFVTRCVNEAVKPYLNRTTEPAPAGMYDQELAGVIGDDADALDRKASEQLLRSKETSLDRVRLQRLEEHFTWLKGVVLSWLRHALRPKCEAEDEPEMRFDSPKFQQAIDEIRAYNEEAERKAALDKELEQVREATKQMLRDLNMVELQNGTQGPRPRCCCCGGRFHP